MTDSPSILRYLYAIIFNNVDIEVESDNSVNIGSMQDVRVYLDLLGFTGEYLLAGVETITSN